MVLRHELLMLDSSSSCCFNSTMKLAIAYSFVSYLNVKHPCLRPLVKRLFCNFWCLCPSEAPFHFEKPGKFGPVACAAVAGDIDMIKTLHRETWISLVWWVCEYKLYQVVGFSR